MLWGLEQQDVILRFDAEDAMCCRFAVTDSWLVVRTINGLVFVSLGSPTSARGGSVRHKIKHSTSAVAISRDGATVAAAEAYADIIWLYDTHTGKPRSTHMSASSYPIQSLEFSPHSDLLLIKRTVYNSAIPMPECTSATLVDGANARHLRHLQGHVKEITICLFGPDCVCTSDGVTIKVWTTNGTIVHTLQPQRQADTIVSAALSANQTTVWAAVCNLPDPTVHIITWCLRTGTMLESFGLPSGLLDSIQLMGNVRLVSDSAILLGSDGVAVWRAGTVSRYAQCRPSDCFFTQDGTVVVAARSFGINVHHPQRISGAVALAVLHARRRRSVVLPPPEVWGRLCRVI